MKKILLYKTLTGLIFLSCLTLFTISCKKDQQTKLPKTENITVQEAKAWLKKNQPALDLGENWEHPVTMTTGAGDNILKIRINETLYQKKTWVLRDILFQKDANGNIQSIGYKVFLDTAYFSNKKGANLPSANKREFIQNSDFTGKIILYTLNNDPIKGVEYLNGKKTTDLVLKDPKKSGFKIIMGQAPMDVPLTCYGGALDDHQYCDGGGGPEDQPPFDGRQFIEPGNRDTPTPQAPDYSWLFPPTNPANNPAPDNGIPIGNPGNAGGGSTSAKEIKNGITDPCLKATMNEALASNKDIKGFLSDVINKYAGKNNGIVINLLDGNINRRALTNSILRSDGTFEATITFQQGYYNDVSKESAIATMLHEVVHAYLTQTNSAYRNLPDADQHNFLFQNFVKDIASYLINKYSMPTENAYGLAWSGIGDVFNNAKDNDTFQTESGKTMTKAELGGAASPYNYIGEGSKGTPNCSKN